MKRVFVMASTFPRWGNDTVSDFVFELSTRLAKLGFEINILAPHSLGSEKYEKIGRMNVHRFQYFIPKSLQRLAYGPGILINFKSSMLAKVQVPFFLLSEYLASIRIILKHRPDIIHAHWIIPQGMIASILKSVYKIPFVISVHGSDLFPLKSKFFSRIQRSVIDRCEVCTVNSLATKNEITRRFPEYRKKIEIIPMGVDTKLFTKKNLKSKFRQYYKRKVILFVGRLNEQKGVQYLIKSMVLVKEKIPNSILLIIGQGDYQKYLESQAKKLNIEKYVKFLGSLNHRKLADYYNLAEVVVLPSITGRFGTEGQGLVLVEAMSCGTCVIGTDSGGIKDTIKSGYNGLLAEERNDKDLAEKINLILKNERLRNKLSSNGRKFARARYSWELSVKKFRKIYNRIK